MYVLVQQPLGLGYPNQLPFPLDIGHASGNTSPWRPPLKTRRPPSKENSQSILPLFYDTLIPAESPKTTPPSSTHPPSYHPSPMQPAKKKTAKILEQAKPPMDQILLPEWTTLEEEDQPLPTTGPSTYTWMLPWQAPEESLAQFHIQPY